MFMFEAGGPCPSVSSVVLIVQAFTSMVTAVLVAFITKRGIQKDVLDSKRWSNLQRNCPWLVEEEREPVKITRGEQ